MSSSPAESLSGIRGQPRISNSGGELVAVLPAHRFNEAALTHYLERNLPEFHGPCVVRQFQGGLSNPTYHLELPDRTYVLRKKPPGVLLPSAHAIDREFRVLNALAESAVPVPKAHLLCNDETVIGQIFYVMDCVEGRVFTDMMLPGLRADERTAIYDSMNAVLTALRKVEYRRVGLDGFGNPEGFLLRQVARWSKQYTVSKTEENVAMDRLSGWLRGNIPTAHEAGIVHGDYRLGNLLYHPTEPKVVAVLDWELATIGHPVSDLAYNCIPYYLSAASGRGFADIDFMALGIPAQQPYLADYCRRANCGPVEDWRFFVVFSLFRLAAILAGVYRRAIDGNAPDPRSLSAGVVFREIAARAWDIANDTDA